MVMPKYVAFNPRRWGIPGRQGAIIEHNTLKEAEEECNMLNSRYKTRMDKIVYGFYYPVKLEHINQGIPASVRNAVDTKH